MATQQEVLNATQRYLRNIKKSGPDNIMATCPFHSMGHIVTTTFALSLTKGLYFCFSCKARGNLQKFLQEVGLSRASVQDSYGFLIEDLAKYAPKPFDPLKPGVFEEEPIPEALLGLFDKWCPTALLQDGFTEQTLRAFDVGFDEGHLRITYPIRDLSGKLVGISGKTVTDDGPKYKVYRSEYRDFNLPVRNTDKRKYLWNAHQVYPEVYFAQTPTSVVVVEGFKACMWLTQCGIKNVVALMGSYMSMEQKWVLEHMGATVYLMLDNDDAGRSGMTYIGRDLAKSLDVRMVEYEAPQPDSLSLDEVVNIVPMARDYYLWAIQGD